MPRRALEINTTTGSIQQTPDLVESSEVSTIPTLHSIPRANAHGKIDAGWLPEGWNLIEGVSAWYWTNQHMSGSPTISRIESVIDFSSSPTGLPSSYISARFEGIILPAYTEVYTLILGSDDGSRLYVNDELRIDAWHDQSYTEQSTTVNATANQGIRIVIEWYQAGGVAACRFFWESSSQSRQIVPASAWQTEHYGASGSAFGDLSGSYPAPTVARIRNRLISTTAPTTGQALVWNGTSWAPSSVGDAVSLRGRSISESAPQSGQALLWNGTSWAPSSVGDAVSLRGRSISESAPQSGQALVWNGTSWAPSSIEGGGGSGDAVSLRGRSISETAPTTGQALVWNGTVWQPQTITGGGGGTLTVQDSTTTVHNVHTIIVGDNDIVDQGNGVVRIKTAADALTDPVRQPWTWETIDDFEGTELSADWVVAKQTYADLVVSNSAVRLRVTANNIGDLFLFHLLDEPGTFCYVARGAFRPMVNGSNGEGVYIGIGVYNANSYQATVGIASSFDQWTGRMNYYVTNLSVNWSGNGSWSWHGNPFAMNLMPFVNHDVRVWVGRSGSTYGFGLMNPAGYFAPMWQGSLSFTPTHFTLMLRYHRVFEVFPWISNTGVYDLAVDWVKKLVL